MDEDIDELIQSGYRSPFHGPGVEARLRRAIAMDPQNAEAYYVLGSALHRARKYGEAIEAFRTALKTSENQPERKRHFSGMYYAHRDKCELDAAVHCDLGKLFEELGRFEEALEEYERSRPTTADAGWPRYWSAQILMKLGRVDEAIGEFEQALQHTFSSHGDDSDSEVRGGYAEALLTRGDLDEAIRQFRLAIAFRPYDGLFRGLARALKKSGDLEGAAEVLAGAGRTLIVVPNDLVRDTHHFHHEGATSDSA